MVLSMCVWYGSMGVVLEYVCYIGVCVLYWSMGVVLDRSMCASY